MEQNKQNTALLIMDMQAGIVSRLTDAKNILGKVNKALAHARANKMPVIYVVVGFRKGAPEVSLDNKGFGSGKAHFANMNMDEFMAVHPEVAPQEGEITCVKRRVCAFTGSDLDVVLSAYGIEHMVLTGIATSGVVLSTVREAADKDYRITVLEDGCEDMDEEVHRVLTTKVFPRQAEVMTVDEWCSN